jgi:hypothetical protein
MQAHLARLLAVISLLVAPLFGKAQERLPGPPSPDDPGGRIIVAIPPQCLQGTVIKIIDPATNAVVATLTPTGTTGIFDSGCTLPCPKKYIVRPENPNCTFTPAQKTVAVRCCPKVTKVKFSCDCADQGGRIVVKVPQNCLQGTTVHVMDLSGNPVVSGAPDANGLFDTGCKLKCPTSYVVKVGNPNCTFIPSSKIVQVSCCPKVSTAVFDCNCPPARGRIVASVGGNCPPGTTIEVFDNGTLVASGQVNAQGVYDTGCTLPCGKTYTVEAKNPQCTLTPCPQQVYVPCCPDLATVRFSCDCPPPPQAGRIVVHLPANCTSGTVVSVLDPSGQVVASGSPTLVQISTGNIVGEYDTSCTLVCGQTYTVTATNPTCTIYPVGGVQATANCCPNATVVTLDCNCPPPPVDHGRIVVTVNGPCGAGANVTISDPTGNPVMSGTTDNQGVYDTGCQLNCPGTYVVTVYAQGQIIGSQQVSVGCCPDVTNITIDCPQQSNCYQPPTGMVAWYPLDEPQGALSYVDIAGQVQNSGLAGGNPGPQAVTGMVGGAQYFYGSAATYIDVPPHPELDFGTGSFSIDAWVNVVQCSPSHLYPIVEKYDVSTQTGYSFFIVGNQLNLTINGTVFSSNTIAIPFGTWHHVAVTVNRPVGGPAVGTFWLDGTSVGTFTPPSASVNTAAAMWIGRNYLVDSQQSPYCEIAIDELELFNIALDQSAIAGIYNAGSAGKCKPSLGRLLGSSSPGFVTVMFKVEDSAGNTVFLGGLGGIDTGCTLFCGATYTVKAWDQSTGTVFTPKQVTVPCCPQQASVFFP